MTEGSGSAGTSRWETVAAGVLTLAVAALLAVRLLHAGGLWRDEAGAARLATLPTFGEAWGLFQHEAFPLLFPVTLRAYTFLAGGGDQALRAFGLAVGLVIVGILWWNARAARTVPLLSLALLGLGVPFLVYGDSLRGYGLGSALILLTFGLLARALGDVEAPPSPAAGASRAALTMVAAVASVQVLLSNAALLGALCVAACIVAARRRRWGFAAWVLGCGAIAALSLLPYAGPLAAARRQWSVVVTYPTSVSRIWHGFADAVGPRAVLVVWLLLVVTGLAGVARGVTRRRDTAPAEPAMHGERVQGDMALFAALTIPCALLANGVFLKTLSYRPRPWYFLPLMALVAGALDVVFGAISRSTGRRVAVLRGAAVLVVAGAQLGPLVGHLTMRQTDVDLVARQVARSAVPEDLVVVNPWYAGVSFQRYYAGPARWLTLPDIADHRVHRYDLLKIRLAARDPLDDVLEAVETTLRSGHRVWLVGGARWPRPGEEMTALPPAPGSPEGWHDRPYVLSWSRQLGSFLQGHAGQIATVAVPVGSPISDLENLPLVVVAGWRR